MEQFEEELLASSTFLVLAMSSQENLDLPQNGILDSFAVAVKKSFEPCGERNEVFLWSILAIDKPVCVNQKIGRDPPVILHYIFIFKLTKIK